MKKKKIILDVDTGSDDAVAIMCAVLCDELEVLGITVVHGNLPLQYTLPNTLQVVEMLKADVPVFGGCAEPLVRNLTPGRRVNAGEMRKERYVDGELVAIHEKTLPLPPATIQARPENACVWILETLKNAKEKITLVPVGPLTNIAMVLRMDPTVAENIEEIVCMGGGVNVHNRSYSAETNFYNDPEAAKIVLNSGIPITLVTLDATHSSWFGYPEAEKLAVIGNPAAKFAGEMLRHRIWAANKGGTRLVPKSALHDVLAMCAVIDKSVLLDVRHEKCDVDIGGGIADGALLVDTRPVAKPDNPTYIAYKGDTEKLFTMLYSQLLKFNPASEN